MLGIIAAHCLQALCITLIRAGKWAARTDIRSLRAEGRENPDASIWATLLVELVTPHTLLGRDLRCMFLTLPEQLDGRKLMSGNLGLAQYDPIQAAVSLPLSKRLCRIDCQRVMQFLKGVQHCDRETITLFFWPNCKKALLALV